MSSLSLLDSTSVPVQHFPVLVGCLGEREATHQHPGILGRFYPNRKIIAEMLIFVAAQHKYTFPLCNVLDWRMERYHQ